MDTEESSRNFSMQELVSSVGGPMESGENRKGYLSRVAKLAGVSFRVVCAAFYGEHMSSKTEQKLKEAAALHEARILADRLEHFARSLGAKDADGYSADIDAFRQMAERMRNIRMPGDV